LTPWGEAREVLNEINRVLELLGRPQAVDGSVAGPRSIRDQPEAHQEEPDDLSHSVSEPVVRMSSGSMGLTALVGDTALVVVVVTPGTVVVVVGAVVGIVGAVVVGAVPPAKV